MQPHFVMPAREKLIAANLAEHGEQARALSWITSEQAGQAQAIRARMLETNAPPVSMAFKETKPHWGPLSPGCRICGQGQWSCLFINGKCNCRCFYCPTAQDDIGVPTTNRIPFANVSDYSDYVQKFDFKGVSISGGEPLLTFDRTISFIDAVRKRKGDGVHIWLYTNGTLVTSDRLRQLQTVGLDEIRFDISAVGYDLSKVRMAADFIACVTVEIPAIPEDLDQVAVLLPELHDVGVSHLNLHQLRLTPHNSPYLSKRDYTFLHGEAVTVLESELAALALIERACQNDLKLAVHYCAFAYKRRYQHAAARRRNAHHILKGYESITENGFIRSLTLTGDPDRLNQQTIRLGQAAIDPRQWSISAKKDRLFFHEALWPLLDLQAGQVQISYAEAVLSPVVSYRCTFKEIRLDSGRKVYIEKRPVRAMIPMDSADRTFLEGLILRQITASPAGKAPCDSEITAFELIRPGLQDYF